jgi:hypothetical protein
VYNPNPSLIGEGFFMLKKKEIFIILVIILISIICIVSFYFYHSGGNSYYLIIEQNDTIIYELPLNQNIELTISDNTDYNNIIIKDTTAFVESANCKNQVCVNSPKINSPGETIACLPHNLLLSIKQKEH